MLSVGVCGFKTGELLQLFTRQCHVCACQIHTLCCSVATMFFMYLGSKSTDPGRTSHFREWSSLWCQRRPRTDITSGFNAWISDFPLIPVRGLTNHPEERIKLLKSILSLENQNLGAGEGVFAECERHVVITGWYESKKLVQLWNVTLQPPHSRETTFCGKVGLHWASILRIGDRRLRQ